MYIPDLAYTTFMCTNLRYEKLPADDHWQRDLQVKMGEGNLRAITRHQVTCNDDKINGQSKGLSGNDKTGSWWVEFGLAASENIPIISHSTY